METTTIAEIRALRLCSRPCSCRKQSRSAAEGRGCRRVNERRARQHISGLQHCPVATRAIHGDAVYEVADAFETLKTLTSLGAAVGILTALTWSSLPLLATPPEKESSAKSDGEEDEAGIKWGLMSIVSCLPLFNWLAWIFAAFENEERASFYYILAAIYAVPQLSAGFEQDWLSLLTLFAGIAHVQVERVAEERGLAKEFNFRPDVGDAPERATKLLSSSARKFADSLQSEEDEKKAGKKAEEDYAAQELKKWDELFKSRDSDPEKQGGKKR